MAGWNERRLENLEAECPERPRLVVLSAEEDRIEAALAAYLDATPEEGRGALIVLVRRIMPGLSPS